MQKDDKTEEKSVKPPKSAAAKKSSGESNASRLLSKEDEVAIQRNKEFNALPPEKKVVELQRQLKQERVRAVSAESELSELKKFHQNAVYHKDGIINNLQARLDKAETRIHELEILYCPEIAAAKENANSFNGIPFV